MKNPMQKLNFLTDLHKTSYNGLSWKRGIFYEIISKTTMISLSTFWYASHS
jgi:hypothetical protein